ncbi:NUDIX domain-containing protein [Bacillus haimaensis]|uniref:NUDIX hydrolase n=1 Tax=Bacillus haimaensis TaxID=3160967 RepID=UPI003AA7ACF6
MFHVNVEGAVFRDGKWLVIKRSKKEGHAGGLLSLVGGTVDPEGFSSNILERTVQREMFEEVGVRVKDEMVYVRNTSFILDDGSEVIDIVYLCELLEGEEAFVKSPDEVEAVYWLTTEEIIQHQNAPVWLIDSIKAAEAVIKVKA